MNKYSKVYLKKGEKHFGFRYNFTDAVLENVSRWDFRKDPITGKYGDVILDDWTVTSSIGLSRDNWKESPQYWIEQYQMELDEECAHLVQYI